MKKLISICLLLALVFSFTTIFASAEIPYPYLHSTIPGAMEPSEIEELEQRLKELSDMFGIDAVVVMANSIGEGVNSADYLSDYYAEGVAEFEYRPNGIAFIYNKGGNKWAITLEGITEGIFTDADLTDLWNAFAEDGTYYEGISWYIDALDDMFHRYDEAFAHAFMTQTEGDIPIDGEFTGAPANNNDDSSAAAPPANDEAPVDTLYLLDEITSMTNKQRLELDFALEKIETTFGISAAVFLMSSTGSSQPIDFAANVYADMFNADIYLDSGIVFVIDDAKQEWAIYLAGRASVIFTEADTQSFFSVYDASSSYFDGLIAYVNAISIHLKNRGVKPIPVDRQLPRLVDEADLFTDAQEADLLERLDELSERQRCDVIIVTVPTTNGEDAMYFAHDYFDYNGYGYGEDDDGILYLLSMDNRKQAYSTYGFGITAFTDAGQDYIFSKMKTDLGDGNYYDAFNTYLLLADEFLTAAHNGAPFDVGNMIKEPVTTTAIVVHLLLILAVCILVAFIIMRTIKKASSKAPTIKTTANAYAVSGSVALTGSSEEFVTKSVSKTLIPKDSDSGGGGSSTSSSSSGRSHGGSSNSF